mmetsp:Transcript_42046/g.68110  ORF Transcript_42046/g.68110 Transcript_42046/m.68110 type:complete len:84 (+) Transcript_42046:209-460(+)
MGAPGFVVGAPAASIAPVPFLHFEPGAPDLVVAVDNSVFRVTRLRKLSVDPLAALHRLIHYCGLCWNRTGVLLLLLERFWQLC